MAIFSKSETEKLQSELTRLTKKRETLSVRLVAAQSAEAAAIESRRRHLVESDDIDLSTGAKMAAAVDAAQRDVAAIEDALSELDRLIAEGRQAIVAARESAARQKRANEIAKRIERLEPLAAQAERQFEALVATLERIAEAADDDALDLREYIELRGHGARLPVTSIIGASLAQALFRDAPDLMTVEKSGAQMFARVFLPMMIERYDGLSRDIPIDTGDEQSFTPKPLSGALQSNLIAPLRTAAAEILNGSRPITSAAKIAEPEDEAEPVYEHRSAVLVRPIKWRDVAGNVHEHADASADLPEPVIIAAKAAGVAFDNGTPEAAAQLEARFQRGVHHPTHKMNKTVVDLDVKWPKTTARAA